MRAEAEILRIKGDIKDLLQYGFIKHKITGVTLYKKELPNGNNYIVSEVDGALLHFNQVTVHNEMDGLIYKLALDGKLEIV